MPQTAQIKENKMGTMPVGPLLASMSIPMMLSMMVQALYNIVDSVFVSMISENALTAVSLAFPIQTLMISFAVGLAVGINAFLSRSLGQKNFENVNKSAVNGIFIELLVMAAFRTLVKHPLFQSMLAFMEPCIAGIVLAAGTYMMLKSCFHIGGDGQIDLRTAAVIVLLLGLMYVPREIMHKRISPILFIAIGGAIGALFWGIRS